MVAFLLEAVAIVAFVQQSILFFFSNYSCLFVFHSFMFCFFFSDWANGAIVLALLILNAILGVFNEWRADVALQKIKQKLQVKARVLRNGQWGELNAKELVPDDVVRIRVGDFIPAVREKEKQREREKKREREREREREKEREKEKETEKEKEREREKERQRKRVCE